MAEIPGQPGQPGQGGEGGAGAGASGGQAGAGGQQTPPAGGQAPGGQGAGAAAAGAGQGASDQTQTPGLQAGGFKLTLTDAQRKDLLDGKPLELAEEQYTGGVRQQIEAAKRRAATAERKLAEIATATEEAERKALVEQEKFKELYERERQDKEKLAAARQTDLVRSRFQLAAVKANVVDPEVAFVIAQGLPGFAEVKIDEAGSISGVDELLKSLIESKPYLVSQQQDAQQRRATIVGGPSNPGGTPPAAPKTLAEAGNALEEKLRAGLG